MTGPGSVNGGAGTRADVSTQAQVVGEYMNSREAALYLHINMRTLLEWARKGIIPGIPLGAGSQRKTWLFSRSALDEHLRAIMTGNRPGSIEETNYVN